MSDPDRYKSRGRKERTPEQLKVLEMAREKARLVIAERTKIKREMTEPPPEPEETEPPTPPPEPEPPAELPAEDSAPDPEPPRNNCSRSCENHKKYDTKHIRIMRG